MSVQLTNVLLGIITFIFLPVLGFMLRAIYVKFERSIERVNELEKLIIRLELEIETANRNFNSIIVEQFKDLQDEYKILKDKQAEIELGLIQLKSESESNRGKAKP